MRAIPASPEFLRPMAARDPGARCRMKHPSSSHPLESLSTKNLFVVWKRVLKLSLWLARGVIHVTHLIVAILLGLHAFEPRESLGAPDRGVNDPKGVPLAEAARHWAFQPPRDHPLPAVKDAGWPLTGVDSFVLAGLEQAGLSPSPPAESGRCSAAPRST